MSTRYPKQFSSPKKVKKHRQLKLRLFILGLLILGIVFLTWYLPKKEILNDREISFLGSEKLIDLVKIKVNNFISQDYFFQKNNLLINSENLNNYLVSNFSEIDSIDIQKNFLKKKLTIKIAEREGMGIFCSSPVTQKIEDSTSVDSKKTSTPGPVPNTLTTACFWFDKNALLFKETPELIGSLILRITDQREGNWKLGSQVLNKKTIDALIGFKNLIKKYLGFEINDFLITNQFYPDLIAQTTLGFKIYFTSQDYEEALIQFKEIINKQTPNIDLSKIKYFDLRTQNRIYYK